MFLLPVPPQIISLPSKWDAVEGQNTSVTCKASGKPAPEIFWIVNGSPLKNIPQYHISVKLPSNNYKSTSSLTLSPARRKDNGVYGCQAKNHYGDVKKSVTLNLMCKYDAASAIRPIFERNILGPICKIF